MIHNIIAHLKKYKFDIFYKLIINIVILIQLRISPSYLDLKNYMASSLVTL